MIASHLQKRLQEFITSARNPLIVVLGPTASGKTAFSVDLAQLIGKAEIVNADSRQLYKYLDIGTAKISPEEMRGVPHHLIDVLDPKEEATAAWYKKEAEKVIKDIHSRGHIPMLVGGSMLYISAVTDDLEFPTEPDLRKSLRARKKMKPCDHLFIMGIGRPRDEVMRRINERTVELFNHGWIDEVRGLIARGYGPNDPAMKSHGYREILRYLQEATPSLEQLQEDISSKTRHYAKRQLTWWKDDPRITWITPD